jgi:hypothetical protein
MYLLIRKKMAKLMLHIYIYIYIYIERERERERERVKVKVKVKVKFIPEQATKAQRECRGIALLFP